MLGDDSKVIVWNLWGALPSPEWVAHFPQHGAICSGTWAPVKHERSLQRIIFGCVDGSIHVYRCTSPGDFSFVCKIYPHSDAVQDLAFDTNYNRLASVGGGQLIVWSIGPQGFYFYLGFPPQTDAPLETNLSKWLSLHPEIL